MTRRRLDAELVRRGLVRDEVEAHEAVRAGLVRVGGVVATRDSTMVAPDVAMHLLPARPPFVSRGGQKLRAALDRSGIDPRSAVCLDAGASTGGFTDALLHAGAVAVIAVDVGYGQLDWSLRTDPRVDVRERTNVRDLRPGDLDPRPSLIVADLSFTAVAPLVGPLVALGTDEVTLIVLVKPQFEAPAAEVGAGGVVHERAVWRRAVHDVTDAFVAAEVGVGGAMASPLRGAAGNVEFFVWGRRGAPHVPPDLEAALVEGDGVA